MRSKADAQAVHDQQDAFLGVHCAKVIEVPAPFDPHLAALSAFCIVFIAVLTIWLWLVARKHGRNL